MNRIKSSGNQIVRSRNCFVCGTHNQKGLGLTLFREGKKVVATFTPKKQQLGFSKAVHGGITAALLDEIVGVACGLRSSGKCATVELSITYRRPLVEGQTVRIEGWYVRKQQRFCLGSGQILSQQGKVLAAARGKFLTLESQHVARFIG